MSAAKKAEPVVHDGVLELTPLEKAEAPAPGRALSTTPTPADLLTMAVNQGADLDRLERLMSLQNQWEAKEARKAFVTAMTRFKSEPITIYKRSRVRYENRGGDVTEYTHASLADVVDAAIAGMAKHGLSHRWDTRQLDGGAVEVTCVITHEAGHFENTVLRSSPDASGGKNNIQAIASTVSYLQRYTLLSATGLATREMDTDGMTPTDPAQPEGQARASLTAEEIDVLNSLQEAAKIGSAKLAKAWESAGKPMRKALGAELDGLKEIAAKADESLPGSH